MIYFVRHGETDYNKQGLVQGQLDIPLNENGILQAQTLRDNLKDLNYDLIYCSPLNRALTTAKIINEGHNKEIIIDSRLAEIDLGEWQGKSVNLRLEEVKYEYDSTCKTKLNAESFEEFHDRCVEIYEVIKNLNKDVLIVSHGGVGNEIKKHLKMNLENWIRHCQLYILGE